MLFDDFQPTHHTKPAAQPQPTERGRIPELVCPAGNLPALKTAVDNGADTV